MCSGCVQPLHNEIPFGGEILPAGRMEYPLRGDPSGLSPISPVRGDKTVRTNGVRKASPVRGGGAKRRRGSRTAPSILPRTFGGAPHQRPLCVKGAGLDRGPRQSPASAGLVGRGGVPQGDFLRAQGSERSFSPQRRKRSSRTLRRRDGGIAATQVEMQRKIRLCQNQFAASQGETPFGDAIFLLVKKDSRERHAKGPFVLWNLR